MTKTNSVLSETPKRTHCACCRPFAGVNHSDCGKSVVDAAQMAALNSIVLDLSKKGRK